MSAYEISVNIPNTNNSEDIAISTTVAGSIVYSGHDMGTPLLVSPTVDCFVRQGPTVAAVADGTDMLLRGGQTYRTICGKGNRLSFITSSGTGFVFITPNA